MPEPQKPAPRAKPSTFGELTVDAARAGDVHRIDLTGELDLATAPRVEEELVAAEGSDAATILVDLSGLTFMDSTGVRLLLAANHRCDRLRLRRGPAAIQRVFELSGVDDVLPFTD